VLRVLDGDRARIVLVKRCIDLHDLLASASTGQARVAVVSSELTGFDADSADQLSRCGLSVVVVAPAPRLVAVGRMPGVTEVITPEGVSDLLDVATTAAAAAPDLDAPGVVDRDRSVPAGDTRVLEPSGAGDPDVGDVGAGRVVAVWGPTGAPGRTTVAVGLASATAMRGEETLLVDADAYGGAVAQHLGVLDEVSGLLSAVRLANAGRLDQERLAVSAREVMPRLRLLTGLPRADRWVEVREGPLGSVLDVAVALCSQVVLDLGFDLEQGPALHGSTAPQRNLMTVAGLDLADEIVVVGTAEPVGLARLARALVDLLDLVPAATVRVVVNRVRPSLGWTERDVRAMVEGFVSPAGIHFLPHDLESTDRALMAGRSLVEGGDSPLSRALDDLARSVCGADDAEAPRRRWVPVRRRTAGRAR